MSLMPPFPAPTRDPKYRPVKDKLREAIAWGTPDRESVGLSSSQWVKLCHEALKRIEELESALNRR